MKKKENMNASKEVENTNTENEDTSTEEQAVEDDAQVSQEQQEIEALTAEKQQLNEKLLRVVAEYDNFRKRTQKEKSEIYPQAVSDTVEKLLPIIDNFERALESECKDAEFLKGVEMTYNLLMNAMQALSLEAVGEVGEEFNPDFHNAVSHIDDENLGQNVISVVMQKGYKIKDRIIRYAMVQVAN